MRPTSLRVATFLLLLLILIERAFGRLALADFWGEDGAILFGQAAALGSSSLLLPYAGSYLTIQRLILLAAMHVVPLSWLPAAVSLSCIVVLAGVMSRIVSPVYDWLIPSPYLRVAMAAMFCLLPGLTEMTGNLCNLTWIFFCWLALVTLKDPGVPLTWIDVGLSVLVMLSIGTAILLVPLLLWRLVVTKDRISTRHWVREIAQLACLVVLGIGLLLHQDRPPSSPLPPVLGLAQMWYDHAARLVAVTPWLGDRLTSALWSSFGASLAQVIVPAFVIWWAWLHRREARAQAILLLVLGMSFWTVIAAMVRPYAMETFQSGGLSFYTNRYSFPMSFAGVLYWGVALAPWATARGIRQAIVVAFVALNVTMSLHRFNISAYGPEPRWQASVNALENSMATGCPRTVVVRQYPDPWDFTYVSPRPAGDCNAFTAVLPSMPKDITWIPGPCISGNVERVEWVGETRVRATGWAYLQDVRRPADAVLVTRKGAGSSVPTAATTLTVPRGDVASHFGANAVTTGWSVEFDLPVSHDPLEFWVLDAERRTAYPSCALTGSFEPVQK